MAAKKSIDTRSRLETCRNDLAVVRQRISEIESAEDDAIETAAAHAAWKVSLSEANDEANRLERLAAKLEREISVETEKEASKAQRQLEAEADQSASAAADLLATNYAKIANLARETLRAIAQADRKVDQANRSRASDIDPIRRVEARVCQATGHQPHEVVSERVVQRWCYDDGTIVPDETVPAIRQTSETKGVVVIDRHPLVGRNHNPATIVELRHFREITFLPEVRRRATAPLATSLSIPSLTDGGIPGWSPIGIYNPVMVLNRLDELANTASEERPRDPEVKLVPLAANDAAA